MDKGRIVKAMVDRWPSGIVARREAREFSGGAVASGTLANADSAGTGPAQRFKVGKNTCYPAEALARWIVERTAEDNHAAA